MVVAENEMENALARYKTVAVEAEKLVHEQDAAVEVAIASLTQELSTSGGENENLSVKSKQSYYRTTGFPQNKIRWTTGCGFSEEHRGTEAVRHNVPSSD